MGPANKRPYSRLTQKMFPLALICLLSVLPARRLFGQGSSKEPQNRMAAEDEYVGIAGGGLETIVEVHSDDEEVGTGHLSNRTRHGFVI